MELREISLLQPHIASLFAGSVGSGTGQAESLPLARPTRMMVALLAFISRATALIEAPSASRCNAFCRCSLPGRSRFWGAFGLISDSGQFATQASNRPADFR